MLLFAIKLSYLHSNSQNKSYTLARKTQCRHSLTEKIKECDQNKRVLSNITPYNELKELTRFQPIIDG